MSRFGAVIALATAMGAALWPWPGAAQEPFPSRTVKIVVPAAPGSTTDTLARIVADQLGQKWGKTAIVENVPGGAMNIGAGNVARAAPDGYTLLVAPPSPLSFNHMLFRDLGYEPTKFVAITMLAKIPNVLVVRKDLPATTLKELLDYGKANPGKLSYASQGVGSTAHLSAAQLEVQAGIKMVHVPYRGAQPALTDVVAGHVDMFFDTLATSVPLYREARSSSWASLTCSAPASYRTCRPSRKRGAGLQVDHLVRIGRATGHTRRPGGEDQPRRRRNPQEQGGRRHAAPDSRSRRARPRPPTPRSSSPKRRPLDQGDQGSGDRAAVAALRCARADGGRRDPAAEELGERTDLPILTVAHVQQPRLAIGTQRTGMKRHAAEFQRRTALRRERREQLRHAQRTRD